MAKFVTVYTTGKPAGAEFEGDYMKREKEIVDIFKFSKDGIGQLVTTIHLDKNMAVQKVGD